MDFNSVSDMSLYLLNKPKVLLSSNDQKLSRKYSYIVEFIAAISFLMLSRTISVIVIITITVLITVCTDYGWQ